MRSTISLYISAVVVVFAMNCDCRSATRIVAADGSGDFTTIQAAVDASANGDTIVVKPGVYREDVELGVSGLTLRSMDPDDSNCVDATIVNGLIWVPDGEATIEGMSVTSGTRWMTVLDDGVECEKVSCSGDWFFWAQRDTATGTVGVHGVNTSTRTKVTLSENGESPALSGDIVVWIDYSYPGSGHTIRGRRLSTGEDFIACESVYAYRTLAISGDIVVWDDNGTIKVRDLTSEDVTALGQGCDPDVCGNTVVWWGRDPNGLYGIQCHDLKTQERSVFGPADRQVIPRIGDDVVAWIDGNVIRGWRLSDGQEFDIALVEGLNPGGLDIAGDIVVWQETREQACGMWGPVVLVKDLSTGEEQCLLGDNVCGEQLRPCTDGQRVGFVTSGRVWCVINNDVFIRPGMLSRFGFGGILAMPWTGTVQVKKNHVYNCIEGIIGGPAVVTDNRISDCYLGSYGGILFAGNTVTDCWWAGVCRGAGELRNNVISGCEGAAIREFEGTVINNTICNNAGDGILQLSGEARNNIIAFNGGYGLSGVAAHSYNCLWGNAAGELDEDDVEGRGELVMDPLFADASAGDYHLVSRAGRWDANSQGWVADERTSMCIDAGDPLASVGDEQLPNGGLVNLGAYGGTSQASLSDGTNIYCPSPAQMDFNCDCTVDWRDMRIVVESWLADSSHEPLPETGRTLIVAGDGIGDYDSIQDAINASEDFDTVVIMPGIYEQDVWFNGKAVTVRGSAPEDPNVVRHTIINGTVRFVMGEGQSSVLAGVTVAGQIDVKIISGELGLGSLYRNTLSWLDLASARVRTKNVVSGMTWWYELSADSALLKGPFAVYTSGGDLMVRRTSVLHLPVHVATPTGIVSGYDIDGCVVAWVDCLSDRDCVYARDTVTGEQWTVADDVGQRSDLRVSADRVVWMEGGSIKGMAIRTSERFVVCETGDHIPLFDLSGDVVVWEESGDGQFVIYGKDLRTSQQFTVASGVGLQPLPRICGEFVVWTENSFGDASPSVMAKNLQNGSTCLVAEGLPYSYMAAEVSGDNVAWQSESLLETFWRPLTPGLDITTRRPSRGIVCTGSSPTITGNLICDSSQAGISCLDGASPLIVSNEIRRCLSGGIKGSAGTILGNTVVDCDANGLANCSGLVANNVIAYNTYYGAEGCSGILVNNTICGHTHDGTSVSSGNPALLNNIFAYNDWPPWVAGDYNCHWMDPLPGMGWAMGPHDIEQDPLFANMEAGDFHLRSEYGRWDSVSSQWVTDTVTSPCIDAGDPNAGVGSEANPNGGRVNIGAYGGTPEASRSAAGGPEPAAYCRRYWVADLNHDCVVNLADFAVMAGRWME